MDRRTVLLGLALGTLATLPPRGPAGAAASALPATPLRLFDGGMLDLRSLAGNVVVIRFLASW